MLDTRVDRALLFHLDTSDALERIVRRVPGGETLAHGRPQSRYVAGTTQERGSRLQSSWRPGYRCRLGIFGISSSISSHNSSDTGGLPICGRPPVEVDAAAFAAREPVPARLAPDAGS